MGSPIQIKGSSFSDTRGKLHFFNSFDMGEIVRLYEISPADTQTVRAWQGHQNEKKWLYCNAGAFVVHLVKLDNANLPSPDVPSEKYLLEAKYPMILEIPGGYANGFKATEEGSKLLVFSNFGLEKSKKDDFRYPVEQWEVDWE